MSWSQKSVKQRLRRIGFVVRVVGPPGEDGALQIASEGTRRVVWTGPSWQAAGRQYRAIARLKGKKIGEVA